MLPVLTPCQAPQPAVIPKLARHGMSADMAPAQHHVAAGHNIGACRVAILNAMAQSPPPHVAVTRKVVVLLIQETDVP